jgi:hypothetical protein
VKPNAAPYAIILPAPKVQIAAGLTSQISLGGFWDPDSSPNFSNLMLEGQGFKMTLLDPGFFTTFPFLSLDSQFAVNSQGNPSVVIIGDPKYLGNYTVT